MSGCLSYLTHTELPLVARKPNYDFERRKKEMDRKAKKEAKREERARRKAAGLPDEGEEGADVDSDGDDDDDDSTDNDATAAG